MTTENKRLIRVRTEKGAVFKRDGFGKKRQLAASWRKPRGQHNKQREQKKAKGNLPKPGFGSPVAVREMHPSGFFEVMVFTEKDLMGINPKTHAARIAAAVGSRKRALLQEAAAAKGIRVLNARVMKKPAKKVKAPETGNEETGEGRKEKKPGKKEAPAAKKAPVKAEKSAKKPAEKKAPAPKPAAKPAKKASEEKAEKAAKPKAKAETKAEAKPAKKAAAAAKPKTEKAAKAKPKKKTDSGVKKHD